MRVDNISLIFNNKTPNSSFSKLSLDKKDSSLKQYETSIYNRKGVTLPFGCIAKGINSAENECIKFLRKARNGRCRQYTEPQINDYILLMRGGHEEHKREKIHVLKDIFTLYDECVGGNPDEKFLKNFLKLTKNQPEREYYSILEFAQHELTVGATEPLASVASASPKNQNRFVQLMSKISDVNEAKFYTSDEMRLRNREFLYEDLRSVIYAAEDAPKMAPEEKLQAIQDVYYDVNRIKSSKDFPNFYAQNKVLKVSREILDTLFEVL